MISVKPDQINRLENNSRFLPVQINQDDSQNGIKTTLKMTGAVVLLIGAHLIFPRLGELKAYFQVSGQYTRSYVQVNHEESISELGDAESVDKYEPPNFGAPNSNHGSGTR